MNRTFWGWQSLIAYALTNDQEGHDWIVTLNPGEFGSWNVTTVKAPHDPNAPRTYGTGIECPSLAEGIMQAQALKAQVRLKDPSYAVVLATTAELTGRLVINETTWGAVKAMLEKHGLWQAVTNSPCQYIGLLGHIGLNGTYLPPDGGKYFIVRRWETNPSSIAIEVAVDHDMRDYIAIAACLAWFVDHHPRRNAPVFREIEAGPRDLLNDYLFTQVVVDLAADVGLTARRPKIDYHRIATTRTWESLV
jgi:hypothetical protein